MVISPGGRFKMQSRPRGVWAITIMLLLSTLIAAVTGVSLLWPGTVLDGIWSLNRQAYLQFAALGRLAGVLLLVLSAVTTVAAVGFFHACKWGWWLVVSLFTVNALGDAVRAVAGSSLKGLAGVAIVGGLLFYLTRLGPRSFFGVNSQHSPGLRSNPPGKKEVR